MANAYRTQLVRDIKKFTRMLDDETSAYVHHFGEKVVVYVSNGGFVEINGERSGRYYRIHTMRTLALKQLRDSLRKKYEKEGQMFED